MLFDVVVDVLERLILAVNTTLSTPLSAKLSEPIMALQYVDDTAVIANSDMLTVITLKIVLRLFIAISGLTINYAKSIWIPINMQPDRVEAVEAVLGCKRAEFPITYLGMPLTVKRPTRGLFLPLIEKLERKLEGWKGKLISRGGRLQLVNSVLLVIPIYHMACFRMPQWVIKRMDRIRRTVLWGKPDRQGPGVSMINWQSVCLQKQVGGLGVSHLEMKNISLLLRWWWRAYKHTGSLWTETIHRLRWSGTQTSGPNIWSRGGSFFWKQLLKIKPFFHWSTRWIIGDGFRISFWFDSWMGIPLLGHFAQHQRPQFQSISLREAIPISDILLPDTTLPLVRFSTATDELSWNWGSSGVYTAQSFYKTVMVGGRQTWSYMVVWKYKIPLTVKIFAYLLLKGKLLTHDVMKTRYFHCNLECVTCATCPLETAVHLFFECPFALQVWSRVTELGGN